MDEHVSELGDARARPVGRCLSVGTLTQHHTVMGQSLIQCLDTLNRHRERVTAPPRAFSRHAEVRGRARIGDSARACAAHSAMFECWCADPAPHDDGTTIFNEK